jgi:hypothetical protein
MGLLWVSVLAGGGWVFWARGELSGRYVNWMRVPVFVVVEWVTLGPPMVIVGGKTGWTFFGGIGSRGYGGEKLAGCEAGSEMCM